MSRRVLTRTSELLDHVSGQRVFTLVFVVLTALHAGSLQDPPYWDALMGAFAQGHWLATHSFSPLALLAEAGAFDDGGACVYPFSAYPWIVGLLEASGLSPASTFLVLHLVSMAAAATVLAALFVLVRDAAGAGVAALLALALAAQPMFRALACQMNMDMPLAACTMLSIVALTRSRFAAASAWAAAALLVKPTAVILVAGNLAALVARLVRPSWFGVRAGDAVESAWKRGARAAAIVHALLLAVFVAELAVAAHYGKTPPGISLFGGTAQFLFWRLWTLPEFGLMLAAALCAIPFVILPAGVRGARDRVPSADPAPVPARAARIDLALFVLAFTGFYCQYENVLPRYFLQAWPLVLALLVLAEIDLGVSRRAIGIAFVLLALFGIANTHGRFHPTRRADWNGPGERELVTLDGWLLERSLEYQDGLALDRELARRLEHHRDRLVVAGWPLLHALALPRMGYVRFPPDLASAGKPIRYAPRSIVPVGSVDPPVPTLRVLTPNVYDGESSRILPGDEVLEVVEKGRLRAFIVLRPADSRAGSR